MLAGSFRLVTARLIPRAYRCKQALLLAVLILSGCGGSGQSKAQEWQAVTTSSFHFRAPKAWRVTVASGRTTVKDGSDFVQVAIFPLAHPYTASLFQRVQSELGVRMAAVARASKGSVAAHHVVTVDGSKSHAYDVRVGNRTDRYTFLLRDKREFLLVCSAGADVCDELAASFVAG